MKATPLVALPGTLLGGRSMAALLQGRPSTTMVLGEAPTSDAELDRLVAVAPVLDPPGHPALKEPCP